MVPGYTPLEDGTIIGPSGKRLKPIPDAKGYQRVSVYAVPGVQRKIRVHLLVCEAFHGPKPFPDAEVRHLNGVRTDNRAENLAWGTAAENQHDRVLHGTAVTSRGEQHPNAALTEKQVQGIRSRYADGGVLQRELAAEYGVSVKTINHILCGRRWTPSSPTC